MREDYQHDNRRHIPFAVNSGGDSVDLAAAAAAEDHNHLSIAGNLGHAGRMYHRGCRT